MSPDELELEQALAVLGGDFAQIVKVCAVNAYAITEKDAGRYVVHRVVLIQNRHGGATWGEAFHSPWAWKGQIAPGAWRQTTDTLTCSGCSKPTVDRWAGYNAALHTVRRWP